MKNLKIKILFVFILGMYSLHAQDFHLSQYDAAALNTNPALTGAFRGNYRLHGHYRNQWSTVATRPFTTGLLAFDVNKKKWGVGIQLANFRAGQGAYNHFSVLPSISFKQLLGKKKHHLLSFGLQVGAFQKSIDVSQLSFESQYEEIGGGAFNPDLANGETFSTTGLFNLDLNFGIMYHYSNIRSKINPFIGATVFHINQPKESFFSASSKLPMRMQVQVGSRIALTKKLAITPKGYFQFQEEAIEMTYGVTGQYYLKNPNFFFLFGGSYRTEKDAVIAEIGGKYGNFTARLSYDINISSLNTVTNGRGASEFSITYILNKKKEFSLDKCPKIE